MEMAAKAASPAVADREFKSEGFFEYHLYTLDGRTTIKESQTKQLTLLSAADFPVDKQLHLLRRRELPPHPVRGADLEPEGGRLPRHPQHQGEPPRHAPAQGQGARVQGGRRRGASSSSARTGSTTRRRTSGCGSRWARPSTWWASACRRTGSRSAATSTRSSGRSPSATTRRRRSTVEVIEPMPGDWEILRSHPSAREAPGLHRPVAASRCPRKAPTTLGYRTRVRF